MQMQLPIFPNATKLINSNIGCFEKDNFVYYLHNGSPIYCHSIDDLNSFRYITANLVVTGQCTPSEIAKALGVSNRNIQRYAKSLREKGTDWFFNREEKRGKCHKLNEDIKKEAERLINQAVPVKKVAEKFGVTEGALRYHIRMGNIKKKKNKR